MSLSDMLVCDSVTYSHKFYIWGCCTQMNTINCGWLALYLTTCAARVCGCVLQCLDFWLISVRKTVSFGLILHITIKVL